MPIAPDQERPEPLQVDRATDGPDQARLVDQAAGDDQQRDVHRRDHVQPDRTRHHAIGEARRAGGDAAEKAAEHDEADGLRRKLRQHGARL
jgi:hypothetical protein